MGIPITQKWIARTSLVLAKHVKERAEERKSKEAKYVHFEVLVFFLPSFSGKSLERSRKRKKRKRRAKASSRD